MTTEFCANCFEELDSPGQRCPRCGGEIEAGWRARSFDARLLHALSHPVAEVRLRAIHALGERQTDGAAEPLAVQALQYPADIVEGRAIITALANLDSIDARRALRSLANQHPAAPVRTLARAWLGKPCTKRSHEAEKLALAYIRGRQCSNGGFCFYRTPAIEEPSLHDTFHALSVLTKTRTPISRTDGLAAYLKAGGRADIYGLYYRFRCRQLLHLEPALGGDDVHLAKRQRLTPDQLRPEQLSGGRLKHIAMFLELKRFLGDREQFTHIACAMRSLPAGASKRYTPNLTDTCSRLQIERLLGILSDTEEIAELVAATAHPAHGFIMTTDSSLTSIEVLHAGVICCRLLSTPVPHPESVATFTLGCQSGNGGFARVPGALPDIEMTHLALDILHDCAAA